MTSRPAELLFCLLVLFLMPASADDSAVSVHNAWIRVAPPGAKMLAGYMDLENSSGRVRSLVGVSSADFASIQIHRTSVESGVASMSHVLKIDLVPGERLRFAPGSYHLMLIKPRRALRAGDEVLIELKFDDHSVTTESFEIRK